MTAIEQAIKEAVQGANYREMQSDAPAVTKYVVRELMDELSNILLDPQFWSALGKARGWEEGLDRDIFRLPIEAWKLKWHRFIDHLAEGKDAESFFASLTNK